MPSAGKSRTLVRLGAGSLIAATALALTGCDAASPVGSGADVRQVSVTGTGKTEGTPDTLTASLTVSETASDANTAMAEANEVQTTVLDALVGAGVDRTDIATSNVTLNPQTSNDGNTVTGYQATNTITLTIRNAESASKILGIAVFNGGDALRINNVDYSISDDSQMVKDARAEAFADASARAEQYAELAGMKLGKIISILESPASVDVPSPAFESRTAAEPSSVPLEPGKQTLTFTVDISWELD